MKKQCLACQSKDIQYIPYYLIPKSIKKPKQPQMPDYDNALLVNLLFCKDCHFVALEGLSRKQVDVNREIIHNMLENPDADPSD